jgi:cell wall-associated NlpC family hydrolase
MGFWKPDVTTRHRILPRLLEVIATLGLLMPAAAFASGEIPTLDLSISQPELLTPDFWIARLSHPQRVTLSTRAVVDRNASLLRLDPSMHDLRALPDMLDRHQVEAWMAISKRPDRALFDTNGRIVDSATLDSIVDNAAIKSIPTRQKVRFGLVVHRAALRTFPTNMRVFSTTDDTDLDRFQESALFPGTPVLITHRSTDGAWLFVVSPDYAAWVEASAIAAGSRDQVMSYVDQRPARVITGATVLTTMTPNAPALSEQKLDMGVRLPMASLTDGTVVNGQQSSASWAVEFPTRNADGALALETALIPRSADTSSIPLPLTRANTIRQAFKFLGERYGWGDDGGTRDCSGFVSAVFASMGVSLPRNTGDQSRSPVFNRLHFSKDDTRQRRAAIASLQAGDLVYMPGHVMLVVGRIGGQPYVIHDIHDGKTLDGGGLRSWHLNGVVVTPLAPLMLDSSHRFVDVMTDVVDVLDPREAGAQ